MTFSYYTTIYVIAAYAFFSLVCAFECRCIRCSMLFLFSFSLSYAGIYLTCRVVFFVPMKTCILCINIFFFTKKLIKLYLRSFLTNWSFNQKAIWFLTIHKSKPIVFSSHIAGLSPEKNCWLNIRYSWLSELTDYWFIQWWKQESDFLTFIYLWIWKYLNIKEVFRKKHTFFNINSNPQ